MFYGNGDNVTILIAVKSFSGLRPFVLGMVVHEYVKKIAA